MTNMTLHKGINYFSVFY